MGNLRLKAENLGARRGGGVGPVGVGRARRGGARFPKG
jgi:hypothetical protein